MLNFLFATEKQEVCNTEDVLTYLSNKYHGQLDELFATKSIDDILPELSKRNNIYYYPDKKDKKEKRDLTAVSTSMASSREKRAVKTKEEPPKFASITLFQVAYACRYGSIALLSIMIFIVST